MSKHTPIPWAVSQYGAGQRIMCPALPGFNGGSRRVADCTLSAHLMNTPSPEEAAANAALIVRAVNCHDELVAALKGINLAEDRIVGAQGGDMILRIPMSAINAAAAALSKAESS
jgi:hypothetical protein